MIRLKPCPTDKPLPDKPVLPKDYLPDKEVDVLHDDLYAQAWQSYSEYFTPIPNPPSQTEPTVTIPVPPEDQLTRRDIRSPDSEESHPAPSPDERSNDTVPSINSDNHEHDAKTPAQSSPRKNKYNLRANPRQTGKRIMLIIIQ